jgi:hypothetical protein
MPQLRGKGLSPKDGFMRYDVLPTLDVGTLFRLLGIFRLNDVSESCRRHFVYAPQILLTSPWS